MSDETGITKSSDLTKAWMYPRSSTHGFTNSAFGNHNIHPNFKSGSFDIVGRPFTHWELTTVDAEWVEETGVIGQHVETEIGIDADQNGDSSLPDLGRRFVFPKLNKGFHRSFEISEGVDVDSFEYNVVEPPMPRAIRSFNYSPVEFKILRHYTGQVLSIGEESFIAQFAEDSADFPEIEAEFDFEELTKSDRPLVEEGVPLVWFIGYDDSKGYRERKSVLYVRRIPQPSAEEIESSKSQLSELIDGLFERPHKSS